MVFMQRNTIEQNDLKLVDKLWQIPGIDDHFADSWSGITPDDTGKRQSHPPVSLWNCSSLSA